MDKFSNQDQLDFISKNTETFFQAYTTPINGQVISLRETQVASVLAINFVEPPSLDWNWISSNKETLFDLVKKINLRLNEVFILDSIEIQTFYIDAPPNKNTLNGSLMGQFVIGFNKVVDFDSKKFEKIFNAIKDAIITYFKYKTPTQPQVDPKIYGIDFDFNKLVEIVDLEESFGEREDEIWVISAIEDGGTYTNKRRDFFVVGDIVELTSSNMSDFYQRGKVIFIDIKGFITIDIQFKSIGSDYGNSYFEIKDLLIRYSVRIMEYFDLKSLFNTKTSTSQNSTSQIQTQSIDFDLFIEDTKKEIGQLIFLKSLQSPLDFEENIKINQLISEKQKQLDKFIFEKNEMALSQENVFDDLFEQSFTPIQNTYTNIFVKDEGSSDFFTPNGERSFFNDAINSLIRTPLFLDWFGDWQLAYQYKEAGIVDFPCSKVLSPSFEPQIVWHGTGTEFSYFRFDNFPAAYFAVNESYSKWFADLHSRVGDGFTIPFFLNVRNPLDLTMFETKKINPKTFFDFMFLQTGLTKNELELNPIFDDPKLEPIQTWMYLRNNPKMLKKLADTKIFDGIHFYETNPGVDESEPFYKTEAWIIFDPQQAKLAEPSRGVLLFSSLKSFLLKKGGKI